VLAHIQINITGESDNKEVVSTRNKPNLPKGRAQWIENKKK